MIAVRYSDNPNWPSTYATGTVFGKFIGTDGAPVEGSINFTPRPEVVLVVNQASTVVTRTVAAVLDTTGSFSVELPATDDPDVRPSKFTYLVEENWPGGRTGYDIHVPAGVSTNILDVAPAQPSIGVMRYLGPTGPPGPSNVLAMTDNGDGTETISVSAGVLAGLSVSDNGTGSATIG